MALTICMFIVLLKWTNNMFIPKAYPETFSTMGSHNPTLQCGQGFNFAVGSSSSSRLSVFFTGSMGLLCPGRSFLNSL